MTNNNYETVFKQGMPPIEGGYPGHNPRVEKTKGMLIECDTRPEGEKGMIIEYDVAIRMRDGVKIYIDIFRPDKEGEYPVLIAWTVYGKHRRGGAVIYQNYRMPCGTGVNRDEISEYTIFEGDDPVYWCGNDYIVINAEPRGLWGSEGDATFFSIQEAEDCYDLIEWAGTQSWSNGKVGMQGVSYLAWTQWRVASLNPPHLAAINPWEGVSDFYRELAFHGGIPETLFYFGWNNNRYSSTKVEDLEEMARRHPLFDKYWAEKNADLSKITVPAFVVASWSDHSLHTRGTLEGFKQIASKDKWLLVHGRKKWQHFHQRENMEKQRQFFDRFLKDIDSGIENWPKVKLEIREQFYIGDLRNECEWPLVRTQYKKLFLNASNGKLSETALKKESRVSYNVDDITDKTQNAQFEFEFNKKTELTGYMKLKIWVQANGSNDMDLFVAIQKINRCGKIVPFAFSSNHEHGPVALGWLRVSHRELDVERSTAYQPFHKHQREMKLKDEEIVPVEIEIWPSSTLFERGEKIRVVVQGSDIYLFDAHVEHAHTATVNKGEHVIYTGGKYDSYLLIPVIPDSISLC